MPNISPPSPTPDQKPPEASGPAGSLPTPETLKLVENPISPPGPSAAQSTSKELKTTALANSAVGEVFRAKHSLPFISSAASGTNDPAKTVIGMPQTLADACSNANVKPTDEQMQNAQKHIQKLLSRNTPPAA